MRCDEQNQYCIEVVPYGADFNHSSIEAVAGLAENMVGLRFLFAQKVSAIFTSEGQVLTLKINEL